MILWPLTSGVNPRAASAERWTRQLIGRWWSSHENKNRGSSEIQDPDDDGDEGSDADLVFWHASTLVWCVYVQDVKVANVLNNDNRHASAHKN